VAPDQRRAGPFQAVHVEVGDVDLEVPVAGDPAQAELARPSDPVGLLDIRQRVRLQLGGLVGRHQALQPALFTKDPSGMDAAGDDLHGVEFQRRSYNPCLPKPEQRRGRQASPRFDARHRRSYP
jgi:hypothetical protein